MSSFQSSQEGTDFLWSVLGRKYLCYKNQRCRLKYRLSLLTVISEHPSFTINANQYISLGKTQDQFLHLLNALNLNYNNSLKKYMNSIAQSEAKISECSLFLKLINVSRNRSWFFSLNQLELDVFCLHQFWASYSGAKM